MSASWPNTVSPGSAGKSRVVMLMVCHVSRIGDVELHEMAVEVRRLLGVEMQVHAAGRMADPDPRLDAQLMAGRAGGPDPYRRIPCRLMSAHQIPRRSWVASTRIDA